MKSFALWYKKEDDEQDSPKEKEDLEESLDSIEESIQKHLIDWIEKLYPTKKLDIEETAKLAKESHSKQSKFDLHMNFWSESFMKNKKHFHLNLRKKKKKITPFLDVGIKVRDFRKINSFVFQCPFKVQKDEIKDLANKIVNQTNAQIIFNTEVELEIKKEFSLLKLGKDESLLVYPIEKVFKCESNISNERTNIIFDLVKLQKYIKNMSDYSDVKDLYIRFRIQSTALQDKIYSDREGIDKSFQSRFSGTRILDFKINEERNLNPDDFKDYLTDGYEVASFNKVHLLMMESASCDVQSFASGEMSCREVENDLWEDYCGEIIKHSNEQILAYHWKFSKDKQDLSSVSCMAKVTYSKTGALPIVAYSIIVVALGMISSTFVNFVESYIKKFERPLNPYWVLIGVSALLVMLGIKLNKIKKK